MCENTSPYNAQGYADDTQLYLSFRPTSIASQDQAVCTMQDCIFGKAEFLMVCSRQQLAKIDIESIQVGISEIKPCHVCLRFWGLVLSMNGHIGIVCSKAFYGLYKSRQNRSHDATKTLGHVFVTSHLDYCNLLLYGVSQYQMDHLQRVLNAASRITCLLPWYSHVTPVLIDLSREIQDSTRCMQGFQRHGSFLLD